MGNRRKSRELAIQALFFMDMNQSFTEDNLSLFCENFLQHSKVPSFFLSLVRGVLRARTEIDTIIERFSDNWKMSRMSSVDRNIMRLSVYEMLIFKDIPCKVSINEAVDLGKKYGTEESGAFVNGILDSIRIAMETEALAISIPEDSKLITEDLPEPESPLASNLENFKNDYPANFIGSEFYQHSDSGFVHETDDSDKPAPKQRKRTAIR